MNTKSLIIGGVGGFAPVFINLVTLDANTLFVSFDLAVFLGWCSRALVLFALGAFVVYLNSENQPLKAFQIGIMAPALITGYMNASNLSTLERNERASGASFFVSSAFAEQVDQADQAEQQPQQDSAGLWQRFLFGLTGNRTLKQTNAIYRAAGIKTVYIQYDKNKEQAEALRQFLSSQGVSAPEIEHIDGIKMNDIRYPGSSDREAAAFLQKGIEGANLNISFEENGLIDLSKAGYQARSGFFEVWLK